MVKLVITILISKPRKNEQTTVETELDTSHVRTTEKGLWILKQQTYTNWLVTLEEYPGLNSEDRTSGSPIKVWLGFTYSKMQSNPKGKCVKEGNLTGLTVHLRCWSIVAKLFHTAEQREN